MTVVGLGFPGTDGSERARDRTDRRGGSQLQHRDGDPAIRDDECVEAKTRGCSTLPTA